jgi:hypothetical protein
MPYIASYEIDTDFPQWESVSAILNGIVGLDMPFHELLRARALDLIEEDDRTLDLGRTVGVGEARYGVEVIKLQESPPYRAVVAILMINQSLDLEWQPPKQVSRQRVRRTKPTKG